MSNLSRNEALVSFKLTLGLCLMALFEGGILTLGVICIFLLSPRRIHLSKQQKILRGYIVVLLLINCIYLASYFLHSQVILLYIIMGYSVGDSRGYQISLALSLLTNVLPGLIVGLTDGLLVWRCYRVQYALGGSQIGGSQRKNIFWIIPLCLWVATAVIFLTAVCLTTTRLDLSPTLVTTALALNALSNVFATCFIVTRLIQHRRMIIERFGDRAPPLRHLHIASMILQSAAVNVPTSILAAVGIAPNQVLGWVTAPIAVACQSAVPNALPTDVFVGVPVHTATWASQAGLSLCRADSTLGGIGRNQGHEGDRKSCWEGVELFADIYRRYKIYGSTNKDVDQEETETEPITFLMTIPLAILLSFIFYATGYECMISSMQSRTGFVFPERMKYPWGVLSVVLSAAGPFLLLDIAAAALNSGWRRLPMPRPALPSNTFRAKNGTEPSAEPGSKPEDQGVSPGQDVEHSSLLTILLIQSYFLVLLFGTPMSAVVLRRHLMVWKVFTPLFMAAAVEIGVVDLGVLLSVCFIAGRVVDKVGLTRNEALVSFEMALGLCLLALFEGGLFTLAVICISLLSPKRIYHSKQQKILRGYIIVLLLFNYIYLVSRFLKTQLTLLFIIVGYSKGYSKGKRIDVALFYLTNVVPALILGLTDGLLVWRCYRVQHALEGDQIGPSRWKNIFWIIPLCLWVATVVTSLVGGCLITTRLDLATTLEATAYALNALSNVFATCFIITRLVQHRRMIIRRFGDSAPPLRHLRIASIILQSAAVNVPVSILAAVGIAPKQVLGWVAAPVAIACQSFCSILIIKQVALRRVIDEQEGSYQRRTEGGELTSGIIFTDYSTANAHTINQI
ncbi:hypothetical protein D9756_009051 [Leucocoprinus leucothites]|uniref:Uncharacterized protein n=1 Tax=Leucocoprinus leucothites TaxID=201217 RepID=A0A8H5FUW0_9AGAR|nr:hypothetical protein D9756_010340 [Leucoagaricus leucothites]KAF5350006.1 hypothetical protein D9756_009051 [Leucoagaricus leucothites]